MKVLCINGSPHKNGCTNVALEEAKKILEEQGIDADMMWLGVKPITGCIACFKCSKDSRCFCNDVVNDVLEKIDEYDGFIVGSPVYFASATGTITSFLDRLFCGKSKLFSGKAWASVVSCRRGGATATFDMLNKYPLMNNMYVVGSSYWNQIHGSVAEDAIQDLEGLQTMRNVAKNMAYLIKCMHNEDIEKPNLEFGIKTNFIR